MPRTKRFPFTGSQGSDRRVPRPRAVPGIEARSLHQPLPGGDGFPGLPDLPEPHQSQSSQPDSLPAATQATGARAPTRQPWLTRIAVSHDGLGCIHECPSHSELALAQPRARIVAGGRPRPRTGLSGAVAGTTTPGTAARRTATGTCRRTGTTTWDRSRIQSHF